MQKIYLWFDGLQTRSRLLLLILLGLLIYCNSIFHPFVHDDVIFIEKNPYIADFNLKNIFEQTAFHNNDFPLVNTYYRPLLEGLNRGLYQIFGFNAAGFHFVNVLLHLINGLLVYALFNLMMVRRRVIAFVVALLFLIHPVQSEAVACVSGISNLLFTFFSLIVLCLYFLLFKKRSVIIKIGTAVLMYSVFFLSLLTKEHSIVIPMIIIWYEVCFLKSLKFINWRKILTIGGFGACLYGYFFLRQTLFGHAVTSSSIFDAELGLRLLSIPRALVTHLSLIVFPVNLHYYRNIDLLASYFVPSIVLICVVIGLLFVTFKADPFLKRISFFCWGWFLGSLLPTLNIVPLVNEFSFLLLAEHFLYFPIIGVFIFIVLYAEKFIELVAKSSQKAMATASVVAITFVFSLLTIQQNFYWRSEVALFERMLEFEKEFGRGHLLLAEAYYHQGEFDRSIEKSLKAEEIMSSYLQRNNNPKVDDFYIGFIKRAHLQIAHSFEAQGEFSSAEKHYLKILKLDPISQPILSNIAMVYLKLGELDQAIIYFKKLTDINPDDLMAVNNLGLCYLEVGEYQKAKQSFGYVVSKDPDSTSAKENLNRAISLMNN